MFEYLLEATSEYLLGIKNPLKLTNYPPRLENVNSGL